MTISFMLYLAASAVLTVGLVVTLWQIFDEIAGADDDIGGAHEHRDP